MAAAGRGRGRSSIHRGAARDRDEEGDQCMQSALGEGDREGNNFCANLEDRDKETEVLGGALLMLDIGADFPLGPNVLLRGLGYTTQSDVASDQPWTLTPKWNVPGSGEVDAALGKFRLDESGWLSGEPLVMVELRGRRLISTGRCPRGTSPPISRSARNPVSVLLFGQE